MEVVMLANTLGAAVVNTATARYMSRFQRADLGQEKFMSSAEEALNKLDDLHAAVPAGTPEFDLVERIDKELKLALKILRSSDFAKKEGMSFDVIADMLVKQRQLEILLTAVKCDSEALVSAEQKRNSASPVNSKKYRAIIDTVLFFGVMIDLGLAIALMSYFGIDISRRLATVMDNSRRVIGHEPLNPVVPGNDEIAKLDTVFHEMADKLDTARARERAVLKRLKSIVDTIPLGLVVCDDVGRIVSSNPGAERLFGQEAFAQAMPEAAPAGDATASAAQENIANVLDLFRTPGSTPSELSFSEFVATTLNSSQEKEACRQDGSSFPCEVLCTAYNTTDMNGYLFVISDMTERHEIERLKQSFIAMVSHELRSPLTSIKFCLGMLLKNYYGPLDEQGVKSVEMAERSTVRLISLVNEILDVERLASGRIAISPHPVNMNAILELAVGSVEGAAEAAEINILACDANFEVVADQDRIVQVLVNFLSNAIKFSPKGSTIGVTAKRSENQVEVRVKDRGRGIPGDQLLLVFERFHQVTRTDASEKGGTGLGLAICKAIIEAHGGEIGAESKEGSGSTFWFKIPLIGVELTTVESKVTVV
jgi:signal transduction histidine kinase